MYQLGWSCSNVMDDRFVRIAIGNGCLRISFLKRLSAVAIVVTKKNYCEFLVSALQAIPETVTPLKRNRSRSIREKEPSPFTKPHKHILENCSVNSNCKNSSKK